MITFAGGFAGEPDRLVDQMLVRDGLAAAHAGVRGHHQLRLRVVDARREARRGETAEDDRMDRADARAREHRERGLGDHRHVDQHPVAAAHALRLEHRGEAVHLGRELAIRVGPLLAGLGREVDERLLVAARRQVAVDRVVAQVDAPADEPLGERRLRVIEHRRERRLPVDERSLAAPEGVTVGDRGGGGIPDRWPSYSLPVRRIARPAPLRRGGSRSRPIECVPEACAADAAGSACGAATPLTPPGPHGHGPS